MAEDSFPTYGRGDDRPPPAEPHRPDPQVPEPGVRSDQPMLDQLGGDSTRSYARPTGGELASPESGQARYLDPRGDGPDPQQPQPGFAPNQPSPQQPGPLPSYLPGQQRPEPPPYGYPASQPPGAPGGQPGNFPGPPSAGQPPNRPPSRFVLADDGTMHPVWDPEPGRGPAGPPDAPRTARLLMAAAIATGLYGLLLLVQAKSIWWLIETPRSPDLHPNRIDAIDIIGILGCAGLLAAVLATWSPGFRRRRREGHRITGVESTGAVAIAAGLALALVWFGMVAIAGFGANPDAIRLIPVGYRIGAAGLLLISLGLWFVWRERRPDPALFSPTPQQPLWYG